VLTTSIRPPAPPASRLGRLRAQAARPRPARRSRPAAAVGRALRCVSHWTPSSPRRDCTCPATTPWNCYPPRCRRAEDRFCTGQIYSKGGYGDSSLV